MNLTNLLIKSFCLCPLICSFLTLQIYFIRFSMNVYAIFIAWWAQVDSNHRPRAYQARALTTWAMSPFSFFDVSLVYSRFGISTDGGDDGNRTHDPLLAGQVLSQLSYTPILWGIYLSALRSLKIEQQQTHTRKALRTLSPSVKSIIVFGFCLLLNFEKSITPLLFLTFSIERRWSSRTFRYGYLVTT